LELSIIIVNYNVRFFLEQCLHSVSKAIQGLEAEVWVVDNASTDGSLDYLTSLFPWVHFLPNPENTGYAKANNQALTHCRGQYILFLNPDTIVAEDCFRLCLDFIQTQPSPGAMGIRMLDGSGNFLPESKRAFPSPVSALYKLTGLSALFPRSAVFNHYSLGHLSQYQNHEVDVLAGAFMLLPKSVLDQVGGFDQRFFMYGEDIDLSYRVQKAGFQNYYFAGSAIIHFKGESTRKGSLNYVLLFYNAMRLFVQKNYSGGRAGVFAFFIQLAILIRGAFSMLNRLILAPLKQLLGSQQKLNPTSIAIMAAEGQGLKAIEILNNTGLNNGNSLTYLPEEKQVLQNKADYQVILFCEGGSLNWKQIIGLTADFADFEGELWFHGSGSGSIIGSDSKETSGRAVAPNQQATT
jgi:O-antigen biosynthesis protein